MLLEFSHPVRAMIKDTKQDCLVWYAWSTGAYENDVYTCILLDGGSILHVSSSQLLISSNVTFGIKKVNDEANKTNV